MITWNIDNIPRHKIAGRHMTEMTITDHSCIVSLPQATPWRSDLSFQVWRSFKHSICSGIITCVNCRLVQEVSIFNGFVVLLVSHPTSVIKVNNGLCIFQGLILLRLYTLMSLSANDWHSNVKSKSLSLRCFISAPTSYFFSSEIAFSAFVSVMTPTTAAEHRPVLTRERMPNNGLLSRQIAACHIDLQRCSPNSWCEKGLQTLEKQLLNHLVFHTLGHCTNLRLKNHDTYHLPQEWAGWRLAPQRRCNWSTFLSASPGQWTKHTSTGVEGLSRHGKISCEHIACFSNIQSITYSDDCFHLNEIPTQDLSLHWAERWRNPRVLLRAISVTSSLRFRNIQCSISHDPVVSSWILGGKNPSLCPSTMLCAHEPKSDC